MSSNMSAGQWIGGIIGAVIGAYFTRSPQGVAQGFAIGAGIGGYIDPPPGPNLRGPMLDDKSFQSSAYGVPLSSLHGTIATMGNIIYLENNEYKAISKKEEQGGKGGGGATVTTTTYFATFAIALSEALPGSAVRRIWAGGKLIYSTASNEISSILQSAERAPLYLREGGLPWGDLLVNPGWAYYDGAQTDPDSRMEGVLGVGNCPSYEGTAYIIFYDFELTDFGNGLAGCPIKVEISETPINSSSEPEQIYYASFSNAPAYIDETIVYPYIRTFGPLTAKTVFKYTAPYSANASFSGAAINQGVMSFFNLDNMPTAFMQECPGINDYGATPRTIEDIAPAANEGEYFAQFSYGYQSARGRTILWGPGGLWVGGPVYTPPGYELIICATSSVEGKYYTYTGVRLTQFDDEFSITNEIAITGHVASPTARMWCWGGYIFMLRDGELLDVWDSNLDHVFDAVLSTSMTVREECYIMVIDGLLWRCWTTHPSRGGIPAATHLDCWDIGFTFARTEVSPIALTDLCEKIIGGSDIDVADVDLSSLTGIMVDGYRTQVGSYRANLNPLMAAFLFGIVEDGYGLKAILRGAEPSGEIKYENFVPVSQNIVQKESVSKRDLPSEYAINYLDYSREYDSGEQSAKYPAIHENKRTEQIPVVMSADKCAQLADKLINLSHVESTKYKFYLPQSHLGIKVGKVYSAEIVPGSFMDVQIDSVDCGVSQVIEVSAHSTDYSAYISSAAGSEGDGGAVDVPLVVSSFPIVADIPLINEAYNRYGLPVAIYAGIGVGSFRGAELQASRDTGQTFRALTTYQGVGTVGQARFPYNIDDCFVIDRESQINLNLFCGQLFSVTEAQMMTGLNYCAYGADGRWEIIRYATATPEADGTVTISTLLRGLHGTEWAASLHQQGDFFVFLPDIDNQFIDLDPSSVGISQRYRSVTIGSSSSGAATVDQTYRGVNLKPLSPVNFSSSVAGDLMTIRWEPRTRVQSTQWVTGLIAPVGESINRYEIDIKDSFGNVVKTYTVNDADFFEYSEAQQDADTNIADAVMIDVYQISTAVGRGSAAYFEAARFSDEDPYWDLVQLMINFNGADGSTTFIDSSEFANSITANGNAKISAANFKFGGASGLFDGVGDYLTVPYFSGFDLSSGDWTIESWIYCINTATYMQIFNRREGGNIRFAFAVSNTGKLSFAANIIKTTTASIPLGEWVHVSCCLSSGTLYMSINGAVQNMGAYTMNGNSGQEAYIGINPNGLYESWFGNIDDLRLTKGRARYTANFTPPARQLGKFTE